MEIRKTLLEILKKSWWQISLTIIGIIAVAKDTGGYAVQPISQPHKCRCESVLFLHFDVFAYDFYSFCKVNAYNAIL